VAKAKRIYLMFIPKHRALSCSMQMEIVLF